MSPLNSRSTDDRRAHSSSGAPGRGGRRSGRKKDAGNAPVEPAVGGTETQARDVCLRLLTDRARSRAELVDRLDKKGYTPDIFEPVLDRLVVAGLIDDAEFANQWVHSRHQYSGKGRRALGAELRQKGVAPEVAAQALEQIDEDDERERAAELVQKKLRSMRVSYDGLDARAARTERDKVVRKLVGMLARRGYDQGMAFAVVKTELEAVELADDDLMDDSAG